MVDANNNAKPFTARYYEYIINLNSTNTKIVILRNLLMRLISLIYLIAFISTNSQISSLFGDYGISPVKNLTENIKEFKQTTFLTYPSITISFFNLFNSFFQFSNYSNQEASLYLLCYLGILVSLLNFTKLTNIFYNSLGFFILFMIQLNFYLVGQDFFGSNFDFLLLEIGFLMIFLAPFNSKNSDKITPVEDVTYSIFKVLICKIFLLNAFYIVANFDITIKYFENALVANNLIHKINSYGVNFTKILMIFISTVLGYSGINMFIAVTSSFFSQYYLFTWMKKFEFALGLSNSLIQIFFFFSSGGNSLYHLLLLICCICFYDDDCLRNFYPYFPVINLFPESTRKRIVRYLEIDPFINVLPIEENIDPAILEYQRSNFSKNYK